MPQLTILTQKVKAKGLRLSVDLEAELRVSTAVTNGRCCRIGEALTHPYRRRANPIWPDPRYNASIMARGHDHKCEGLCTENTMARGAGDRRAREPKGSIWMH